MKDVTSGQRSEQVIAGNHREMMSGELAALLEGGSQRTFFDAFYGLVQQKAQKILMQMVAVEADAFIEEHRHLVSEDGHRKVVRNGQSRPRQIATSVGQIEITTPRIHCREGVEAFVSKILPPYMRRDPQLGDMVALLYLHGVSTNKMSEVMEQFYGDELGGFSSSNATRMLAVCEAEYKQWQERRLDEKEYVYIWADGIYFTLRGSGEKTCVLVIIGVTPEGGKEVISISAGQRESRLSWKEVLLDLQNHGLKNPPKLAVGDGALGFWSALREVYSNVKEQRCWVHKIRNVLDKMPDKLQQDAKALLHKIMHAHDKKEALGHYRNFVRLYEDKNPKAVECLRKDIQQLLTFYDFPAPHWRSIRSTNVIESTFATIRKRTQSTGGRCTESATVAMLYKLSMTAQRNWIKLHKYPFLAKVQAGFIFVDGEIQQKDMTQTRKAA